LFAESIQPACATCFSSDSAKGIEAVREKHRPAAGEFATIGAKDFGPVAVLSRPAFIMFAKSNIQQYLSTST
jgi:hypothetical protein